MIWVCIGFYWCPLQIIISLALYNFISNTNLLQYNSQSISEQKLLLAGSDFYFIFLLFYKLYSKLCFYCLQILNVKEAIKYWGSYKVFFCFSFLSYSPIPCLQFQKKLILSHCFIVTILFLFFLYYTKVFLCILSYLWTMIIIISSLYWLFLVFYNYSAFLLTKQYLFECSIFVIYYYYLRDRSVWINKTFFCTGRHSNL